MISPKLKRTFFVKHCCIDDIPLLWLISYYHYSLYYIKHPTKKLSGNWIKKCLVTLKNQKIFLLNIPKTLIEKWGVYIWNYSTEAWWDSAPIEKKKERTIALCLHFCGTLYKITQPFKWFQCRPLIEFFAPPIKKSVIK